MTRPVKILNWNVEHWVRSQEPDHELEQISDHRPQIALFDQDKLQAATNRPADAAPVAEVTAKG
ncbi:hypothetical protein ACIQ9Q_13885 [Streptomyces sp. NPDC094438]|uniref:hypothetical protein n=1 Tax=Streptomyces sp. NPDC094438 TaxID=3366061 RepID=UPI003830F875